MHDSFACPSGKGKDCTYNGQTIKRGEKFCKLQTWSPDDPESCSSIQTFTQKDPEKDCSDLYVCQARERNQCQGKRNLIGSPTDYMVNLINYDSDNSYTWDGGDSRNQDQCVYTHESITCPRNSQNKDCTIETYTFKENVFFTLDEATKFKNQLKETSTELEESQSNSVS